VRECCNHLRIFQPEQDLGVTHGELAVLEQSSDSLRELKQAKHVGDRSPILPYRFGDLLLGQAEFM
jgi:hypothetical protein